ncbi:cytochrome P450 4F6-like [Saccoglossus kowalevskii]|uniref:Cytochrome P450 4F6-like n=1 Tax=Saccoglossus kowalevskii TaxID=10224 RepID=A0ABM0H143_SACKO|nr:PREDICTED: cytochrome P450 4F6-like [Saccoglossus kowalevskii]
MLTLPGVSLFNGVVYIVVITAVVKYVIALVTFIGDIRKKTRCVQQWPGLQTELLTGSLRYCPKNKEDTLIWRRQMSEKWTNGYQFWYGPIYPSIICNSPTLLRAVCKNIETKPGNSAGYGVLGPWLGSGLLVSNGQRWFRSRKLLTPAFHFEILKPYAKIYNQSVDILLNKMEKYSQTGESFEVIQNISLLTLDILLRCAFTWKDNNCQIGGDNNPYVAAVRELADIAQERIITPLWYNDIIFYLTSAGKRFKKSCDFVHGTSDDIIKRRRQELEDRTVERTEKTYLDFLDILLTARDSDGEGLTDLEIRSEADTFLFEGHDTTASSLSWVLYALASHPEFQYKCQQEIDDLLQDRNTDEIRWDDLAKLTYLTQCIKESNRMYPPVCGVLRTADKEIKVDGKTIVPGVRVEINIYGLHHNPDVWPEHMEYKPERFDPDRVATMDPYAYLPFAAGPRNCIGQNFALNEEKVVLARILRKYTLEVDPTHTVSPALYLVLKATNGIKLKIKARR